MQFIYLFFIIVGLIAVAGIIFVYVITHKSDGGLTLEVDIGISGIATHF